IQHPQTQVKSGLETFKYINLGSVSASGAHRDKISMHHLWFLSLANLVEPTFDISLELLATKGIVTAFLG
ncbi:hypothetical protein, partial [Vibrio cyclitrophicus]|uniref:hypothetical protein n=1 Tax=Vibrio cyclitrophicus TaxID=47951 RepID=UPI001C949CF9